jgi:hypothetical protein
MAILWVDEESPAERGGSGPVRKDARDYELFWAIARALGPPAALHDDRRPDTHGLDALRSSSETERHHEHR